MKSRPPKYLTAIISVLISLFSGFTLLGQPVRITASLDSAQILIGDQVNLLLELEKPENLEVRFPHIPENLSEYIEVLQESPIDTLSIENNTVKLVQKLLITSFDSGEHVIPPFWFRLDLGDRLDSIASNQLLLRVFTMEIDTTRGPTDIKMPYDAPLTLKEVTPWILGILLIAAIIFFIFYYISRRKRNLPVFGIAPRPKEPAHIVALRKLDRIRDDKLWQKDKVKEYHSQVTDALRIYIEERFAVPAMEQTTEETLSAFAKPDKKISEKALSNLRQVLTLADLVKFAKYLPLADDNNLSIINAYFFVNETKIEEIQKPEKPDTAEPDSGQEVILN